jgi:hypothetical protein
MSLSGQFKAKLGEVNHHLIDSSGNTGFEKYSIYYCNIANSTNTKCMKVKFYAPDNIGVRYYDWDFGDGTTLRTINKEVEHKYNLETKATWLTKTGVLPHTPTKIGNYTDVKLTVTPIETDTATVYTGVAAIYEIIPASTYTDQLGTGGVHVFTEKSVSIYAYVLVCADTTGANSWLWEVWRVGGTSAEQTSTDQNPSFSGLLGTFYLKLSVDGGAKKQSENFDMVEIS